MRVRRAFASLTVLCALSTYPSLASERSCPLGNEGSERFQRIAGRGFAFASGRVREVSAESGYCLGCHDATIASATPVRLPVGRSDRLEGAENHPVDIPHPLGSSQYRSPSGIDPRLVLEGGKVTCRTCHGGTDPADHYLSMSAGRLCLECHLK